jgi:hypothetical protein
MNVFTITATATTATINNYINIKGYIYFFRFSDGEGKTQAADHETLPDRIIDI